MIVGHGTSLRALALPEQLRQPCDVDGDAPRLVGGEHLGLPRLGFALSRVEVSFHPGEFSGRELSLYSNLPARRGPDTDRSLRWRQARELNPRRPLS